MIDAAPSRHDAPTHRTVFLRDGAVLLASLAIGGLIAALARQDANWDLKNYHFYNAWAFVHGRMGADIAPAQLQTYLNPLVDLPFYAMVAADWPPRAIAFVMGTFAGAGAFFLVKALLILFGYLPAPERRNYVAFAATLGLLAANPVALFASTMNEWQGAMLTMLALWLVLRRLALPAIGAATLVGAGIAAGAAAGLKLTAATFCVGLFAALIMRRPFLRRAVPEGALFGAAVVAGLALTQGFWFYRLYESFGNPFFPYYNEWIRSPWWDARAVLLPRFGARSALEWLYLPLLLVTDTSRVANSAFRDLRLPLLYLAAIGAALACVLRRRDNAPSMPGSPDAWRFVAVFWVVSYVVWLALHGIYRYIMPLELLSGALLLYCLRWLFRGRVLNPAVVVVTVLILASTRLPYFERIRFGDHFLRVDVPPVAAGALVLLVNDEPMSHVLPYFPADARFVGANSNLIAPSMTNKLALEIRRTIRDHAGPLYVLAFPPGSSAAALAAYGLERAREGCAPVTSNLMKRPLQLCPLQRTAQPAG